MNHQIKWWATDGHQHMGEQDYRSHGNTLGTDTKTPANSLIVVGVAGVERCRLSDGITGGTTRTMHHVKSHFHCTQLYGLCWQSQDCWASQVA